MWWINHLYFIHQTKLGEYFKQFHLKKTSRHILQAVSTKCRLQTGYKMQTIGTKCTLQTEYKIQTDKKNCFSHKKRINIRFYNLPTMTLLSRNHLTIFAFLRNVLSFLSNLVPRSLVDKAEGEIWQSKKICFFDWLLHLTPVQSPLWRGFPWQTFFKLKF